MGPEPTPAAADGQVTIQQVGEDRLAGTRLVLALKPSTGGSHGSHEEEAVGWGSQTLGSFCKGGPRPFASHFPRRQVTDQPVLQRARSLNFFIFFTNLILTGWLPMACEDWWVPPSPGSLQSQDETGVIPQ